MSNNPSDTTNFVNVIKTGSNDPYECTIRNKHKVKIDERDRSPPVGTGQDKYPTPVDYLVTSLAACQAAVLAQCLSKAQVDEFTIKTEAAVNQSSFVEIAEEMPENNGIRIDDIDISLRLDVPEKHKQRAKRCLEVYDEGCIVGQSIKPGINYNPETTLETSTNPTTNPENNDERSE